MEQKSFRDKIATVDESGKRVFLYPKKPKGPFYNKRKLVSYILLAFFLSAPFIKIGGNPLLMFNVLERKFSIFGTLFFPHDFHIFALGFILTAILLILFTVIFGRIFCGWLCPQTIFMEMLFRRIEYAIDGDYIQQKKLKAAPWNSEKIFKRSLKITLFYLISFLIANVFLAYLIGSEELFKIIIDNPANHKSGLTLIMVFSLVFFGVFYKFREQVCTTVCPYGRLQGVLTDSNTLQVSYDHKRGEERTKYQPKKERVGGDCIDCGECVRVCPTGIDIRNGSQLECVNCTACMDACDHIMEKVGFEKGLIRITSEKSINDKTPFKLTARSWAYISLMILLMIGMGITLQKRDKVEMDVINARGSRYFVNEDQTVQNIYNCKLVNKSQDTVDFKFDVEDYTDQIQLVGHDGQSVVFPGQTIDVTLIIKIPAAELPERKNHVNIMLISKEEVLTKKEINFSGPSKR